MSCAPSFPLPCPAPSIDAELLRKYGPRMRAAAHRILANEQDAEDAVQDALLCAHRSLHAFRGQSSLATWLHRIVINAALSRLRRRKRLAESSFEEQSCAGSELPSHDEETGSNAEELLCRDELQRKVRREIARLPQRYRQVLELRDLEELDTLETAKRLGIRPGAVRVRLHRARLALRKRLDPQGKRAQASSEGLRGEPEVPSARATAAMLSASISGP